MFAHLKYVQKLLQHLWTLSGMPYIIYDIICLEQISVDPVFILQAAVSNLGFPSNFNYSYGFLKLL